MARLLTLCMAAAMLIPVPAMARDQLRIVGSSTVFPFVAAAAEQFGRHEQFRTPIVESTGTGGGLKMFCEGIGTGYPDMTNASRAIKESEVKKCAEHGITEITELELGYDGIVLANARSSDTYKLTRRSLFLALARDVPRDGKLVANPYKRWREIDPVLPDVEIAVYGPPPSSGTRDAFVELVMEEGCKQVPEMKSASANSEAYKAHCKSMREDGHFIEAGEDDNLIVQKLVNNPASLGVFGYSFLEANASLVKANPIDGVMPDYASIESGDYHIARSMYVYIKNAHADIVPGLHAFARELASDSASGSDGYLALKGLLPLNEKKHKKVQETIRNLTPMTP